jgi:hypothetical protein
MFSNIKSKLIIYFFVLSISIILSSCATICGGASYYAHINVRNSNSAQISYNGKVKGHGSAIIKVPRSEANMLTFSVKDDNCEKETFYFTERKFRGWALTGTILLWTLRLGTFPIPIPVGVIVDAGNNAFWKPSINEKNVTKTNFRHYNYLLDYNKCNAKEIQEILVIDGPYLEH